MIKALIFDLDGTLLDSLEDITNSVNYALLEHNLTLKTSNQVKKQLGYGARALISNLIDEKDLTDEVLQTYLTYYKTHQNELTIPYDGIIESLLILKKQYKLAIVSNKTDSIVKDLNRDIFNNIFDLAIGEQIGYKLKPAPDLLHLACKNLNISPEEAIFFGDTEVDLKTGMNANIKVAFVGWGFRDFDEIKDLNPSFVISDPKDLVTTINKISKEN